MFDKRKSDLGEQCGLVIQLLDVEYLTRKLHIFVFILQ